MNILSRTITGLILILVGIGFIVGSFFVLSLLIYGILFIVLGLFIFLNKKEDKIEERKDAPLPTGMTKEKGLGVPSRRKGKGGKK